MVARRVMIVMVTALLFSSLVTFALSRRLAHAKKTGPTVHLVALTRDVPAGQPIEPGMLRIVDWPANPKVRGSFTDAAAVQNRVSLIPLVAGDLALEQQLAPAGSANGLTRKIPPGMRAIALKSDEVAGVAGFLLPGSMVDVLVTSSAFSNGTTSTVAQDVPVLAAGQKTEPDPDGKPATTTVVTLLVSPLDAEKLALASSCGKIHFVLRNGADRQQVAGLTPQTSTPNQLSAMPAHGSAMAPSPAPIKENALLKPGATSAKAKPDADTVEVIRGGRSSEPALLGSRP